VPATLVAGWLVVFSGSVFKIVYAGFLSLVTGLQPGDLWCQTVSAASAAFGLAISR
jgi:hypothetical protein